MAESVDEQRHPNGSVETPPQIEDTIVEDQMPQEGSSDGEGERAARERLKKTSIAGLAQQTTSVSSTTGDHPLSHSITMEAVESNDGSNRGRPAKKRSFEDITRGEGNSVPADEVSEAPVPKSGRHKRMRSRDIASGEQAATYERYGNEVGSPLREETDVDADQSVGSPEVQVDVPKEESTTSANDIDTDTNNTANKTTTAPTIGSESTSSQLQPSSGFANTSSTSPFGATSPSKPAAVSASEEKSTASNAFASSGLSAFATSEKSPFGAAAATKSAGGFGGASPSSGFGSSSGGFGTTSSSSVFGQKPASGFGSSSGGFGSSTKPGGFGSMTGFGSAKPFGSSGLSSFASTSASAGFGPAKPFGSSAKDREKSDEDASDDGGANIGDENEVNQVDAEDGQDQRFVEQDVETGEEQEETVFSCRAKLYHFEKEWKERGVGTIKINVRYETRVLNVQPKKKAESTQDEDKEDEDPEAQAGNEDSFSVREKKARLIMRTDGVHRVVLNTPVFKKMHIGQSDGSEPTGRTMHLTGLEEGKPRAFQIKIGKEEILKELYYKVVDLREELEE